MEWDEKAGEFVFDSDLRLEMTHGLMAVSADGEIWTNDPPVGWGSRGVWRSLLQSERDEIAAYMIAQWQKWAQQ